MRHTLGWASITLVVGAVGCGGTAFVATTGDAGDDATTQGDTGVKGPDAGHRADAGVDGHHEGTDAKKPGDGGEKKDTGLDGPVVAPDTGVDAGVDATGGKDAGEDTAVPVDAGHDVGVDAGPPPCRVADSTKGIFASPSGVASPCGTFQTPCSITEAISLAQTAGKAFVYLAPSATADGGPGKYDLPSGVTLMTNVSLVGGWIVKPTGWTANCDPNANTTTVLSSTNSVVVTAMGVTGVALDTLTIENVATAGTGESLYGIFATGSTLTLNDVIIQVAAGGAGANGAASTIVGTVGGGICMGAMASAPGNPGTAGLAGAVGPTGWVDGAAGQQGNPGTSGGQGAQGASGPCESKPTTCTHAAGSNTVCQENADQTICGSGGPGGCGGGGGTGGVGGSGGGSSIGVFASDSTITTTGGSIAPGAGGVGGAGGGGALGGAGKLGGAGAPSSLKPITSCTSGNPCNFTQGAAEGAGANGGQGTTGGTGGQGGGGAGGASYAYATSGTGTVTLTSTLTSFVTPAATGGPPNGAPGPAATHN